MNVQSAEYKAWQSACDAEREAWRSAKGRLPGAPEYDPVAWMRWQHALHQANEALHACLPTTSRRIPTRTGGRHYTRP
jgi:hypothetical protein